MRIGAVGELYFESLPGYKIEAMIPAEFTRSTSTVMKYIEEHFDEENQTILKAEFAHDKDLCGFKGRII